METNEDLEAREMIPKINHLDMDQPNHMRMRRRRNTQFKRRILLI